MIQHGFLDLGTVVEQSEPAVANKITRISGHTLEIPGSRIIDRGSRDTLRLLREGLHLNYSGFIAVLVEDL